MSKYLFATSLVVFHFILIFFVISKLSISYKEAVIFFDAKDTLLHFMSNIWINIFGQNDFSIRLSFVILHLLNFVLFIKISLFYLKQKKDIALLIFLYVFMLGPFSSAILINEAIVNQFGILLFVYLFHTKKIFSFLLLIGLFFLDNSFAILFLGLFFYSLYIKNKMLSIYTMILFILSMNMFGFDIHHKPNSYFLPTLSSYSIIFSPFIFIFLVTTLFKYLNKNDNLEKNILWFLSITSLIFSLLLSFRQSVDIDDFAPYLVLGLVLLVKSFLFSLRIKLKEFRLKSYILFCITSLFLIIGFMLATLHSYMYPFAKNIQDDVFDRNYIAKDLAFELKKLNINKIKTHPNMQKRLLFYGIEKGDKYILSLDKKLQDSIYITITYGDFIKEFYISKDNK